MDLKYKAEVMNGQGIERALSRITSEILEKNQGCKDLVLVGLRSRGVYLAKRIAQIIRRMEGVTIPVGILDITLYRDDIRTPDFRPVVKKTEIPFSISKKKVILVDDVLYTGRTIRAALDSIMDLGRPQSVKLAVLIDRGHRELPIRADFVGREVLTLYQETVKVLLKEEDEAEGVYIIELA
ncbi:MAG: bifunctional pyr operon transcriptional regulator/uracil phosphoribosyltransferase PyrR [Candidatus Tectomicrobia bacterium]|uniref:Bifunctional protein PyrR n=1 Tax=Tectimicrobiota bacterium TaxID=2528274 RepID=A0A933GJ45_UNCTE|nr:bifunctional pyr operon transcriptional regulator/uracil phosphoribosyltransferase PyrR [Candidatus Tectomicrobia bacterium]